MHTSTCMEELYETGQRAACSLPAMCWPPPAIYQNAFHPLNCIPGFTMPCGNEICDSKRQIH